MPQLGETDGAAQFPGQGTLSARPVQALSIKILGHEHSFRRAIQKYKAASDAQQLGHAPTLISALALRERLVYRRKGLRRLADTGQTFRQHAERHRAAQDEPRLAKFVE